MKTALYVTFVDSSDPRQAGVVRKIHAQVQTFRSLGLDTSLLDMLEFRRSRQGLEVREPTGRHISAPHRAIERMQFCREITRRAEAVGPASIYMRFQFFDFGVMWMLKRLKRMNIRVLLEIPTYPYDGELLLQGRAGRLKLWVDRAFRSSCAKYIDRIVTHSADEEIFGCDTIRTSNGVAMDQLPLSAYVMGETASLIAVSSMFPWHGYDRLLQGMKEYYAAGGRREIELHLVGEGAELERYRALASNVLLTGRVHFHGTKTGKELDAVFDQASIGVASLALGRSGVGAVSTLKVREYAARGLAFMGVAAGDLMSVDSPYRLCVPHGEEPVDMESVIEFYDGLRTMDFRVKLRQEVSAKYDMSVTLKEAALYMKGECA